MSKKLLISVFLFFFVFSLMLISQEESKEKKIWEDERISITVDKMERADSFPERLKSRIPGYTPTYIQPKKGYDLVFIHMTIVEKRDLKIEPLEVGLDRPNSPHLIDDRGKTHWAQQLQLNITIPEKKTGYLIFIIPKDVATPVQLKYIYPYKEEPPMSKKIQYGCVFIKLYKIKVNVEEAIIRLRSQSDSESVGKAPLGTVFNPERKVGEWYEVSFRDESGFIINGYIHESEVDVLVEIDGTPEIK